MGVTAAEMNLLISMRAFTVVLLVLVVAAVAVMDGRPHQSELCTTIGQSALPMTVTHDDVCLRLTSNLVWHANAPQPAISWHGKRGQLQFSGNRLQLTHPCGRGLYIADGGEVTVFDAAISATEQTQCSDSHGILGDYGGALTMYGGEVHNVTTGVFVRAGGSLQATDVNIVDFGYMGIGCWNTIACVLERIEAHVPASFNFQYGIILGGHNSYGRQLSVYNSMWKGVRINGTGPTSVEDVSVEGPFGLLIEVQTQDSVALRNVRTSASDYYPSHIGVVEAASMTIDGWTARDGDVGLITDYAATVRGISVRNSDVSGMYYGAYMRDSTWNLMLKDNTFATCCVGVYAQVNAHNIIIADTLFENNFVAMDIITPEVVASGNLNTGDGGGMCYYPLRRRRGNVPPAAGAHIEVAEDEPWWIVDHPFTNATVPN